MEGGQGVNGRLSLVDGMAYFGSQARSPFDTSLAAVVRSLDQGGIDRALLVSLVALDYDTGAGNADTLAVCRESRRFLPLAVVHPFDPCQAAGTLGADLKRAGFAAAGFFPVRQNWPLEAWPVSRMAEGLSKAGLTLFFTVGGQGEPSRAVRALSGVAGPVVLRSEAPAGYTLTAEYLALGRDFPNLHFDVGNLVGCGAIERLAGELGAERLLWGSGTPFTYPGAAASLIRNAALAEEERAWLMGRTILRLLGEA